MSSAEQAWGVTVAGVAILSAVLAMKASRRPIAGTRRAWIFAAVAAVTAGLSYSLDARALLLVSAWASLLALVGLPRHADRDGGLVRRILEVLIVTSTLLFTAWLTALGPVLRADSTGPWERGIDVALVLSEVLVLTGVIVRARRIRWDEVVALAPAFVGLTLVAASAVAQFAWDGPWPLLPAAIGWAGVALGAYRASHERRAVVEMAGVRQSLSFVPWALAATTVALEVIAGNPLGQQRFDAFLLWDALVVALLVIVLQVWTSLDNHFLARDLEEKVHFRTSELQRKEEQFRALVQHSSDVITITSGDLIVRYQSPSVERIYGYEPDIYIGRTIEAIVRSEDVPLLLAAVGQAMECPREPVAVEVGVRHADGDVRPTEATVTSLLDEPSVCGIVFNMRDVGERRALEDQLTHQAFHDSLTGLANRALFRDRLEHALARGQRTPESVIAVLFLDLDGFKAINDSLGHASGDVLLQVVARRLESCLRPSDTVARLGGDEFAILLEDATEGDAAATAARRVLDALEEPILVIDRPLRVHASVGVVTTAEEEGGAEELLRDADVAMYIAKANGKARFAVYQPGMHEAVLHRLELEEQLGEAIAGGQLRVQYQPIVVLATGRITGFEALVRWEHPRRGQLPPGEFIALAEDSGLIVPLGRFVLEQACSNAVEWRSQSAEDQNITVAVNLSARQFQHPDLVSDVRRILRETGLEPSGLILEITESVLMDDTAATLAQLDELKSLGVMLAVDDFGTGYSSLSYLRRFPVDILKIDRSFVADLERGGDEGAVAQAIVDLGHTLGMTTVAEGVEMAEQLEGLRDLHCRLGQGFYFAHPLDADSVSDLLEQGPLDGSRNNGNPSRASRSRASRAARASRTPARS